MYTEETHYLYLLTSSSNKHYVGVSYKPEHRVKCHLNGTGSRLIKEAISERITFTYKIIAEGSHSEIYFLEKLAVEEYNSLEPNGYNLIPGGNCGGTSSRLGTNNTSVKLTEEQVLEIRHLYSTNTCTQNYLALIYNISRENISAIVRGKSWVHLGGPRTIKHYKNAKTPQDIIDDIIRLRKTTKLTYKQIAEQLNITFALAAKYGKGVK